MHYSLKKDRGYRIKITNLTFKNYAFYYFLFAPSFSLESPYPLLKTPNMIYLQVRVNSFNVYASFKISIFTHSPTLFMFSSQSLLFSGFFHLQFLALPQDPCCINPLWCLWTQENLGFPWPSYSIQLVCLTFTSSEEILSLSPCNLTYSSTRLTAKSNDFFLFIFSLWFNSFYNYVKYLLGSKVKSTQ